MDKKALVLGGGLLQIPLIKKAKEKGFQVFLADYYENPPAKKFCDGARQISTFDLEENYRYAREENIDYILTVGSDQPVLTAALVSEKLGLQHPITAVQGKAFTNKYYMKSTMAEYGLPTPRFRVFSDYSSFDCAGLTFPVVVKPVDSQGQRGIAVLQGTEPKAKVEALFIEAQSFSATGGVIVEEYYEGEEITVNCWVKAGRAYILMNTDRLHYDDQIVLGLCKQQRFPAQAAMGWEAEIETRVQKLVDAFEIKDGPLYIQMIVGVRGPEFVEFGYRIGGGFESEIIPEVTGIDILDLYLDLVTTGKNNFKPEQLEQRCKMGSIFFLFANPGRCEKLIVPKEFEKLGRMFIKENTVIGDITNATSRIGCFSFYVNEPEEYYRLLRKFDQEIAVYDKQDRDLLIHHIWE